MPSLETSLTFFSLALLLGVTPGPDNLFVLVQSATQGRRVGAWVVVGLCLGLVVHTLAVAMGLAALFAASATAFTLLKFVGAAYLLYLAWGAWRAPVQALPGAADGAAAPAQPARRLGGRGLALNQTNPKVVFFFLAFLPQFVQPGAGPVAGQLLWFGLLFIVATLLCLAAVVLAAGPLRARLVRSARAAGAEPGGGRGVAEALALRLAVAQR